MLWVRSPGMYIIVVWTHPLFGRDGCQRVIDSKWGTSGLGWNCWAAISVKEQWLRDAGIKKNSIKRGNLWWGLLKIINSRNITARLASHIIVRSHLFPSAGSRKVVYSEIVGPILGAYKQVTHWILCDWVRICLCLFTPYIQIQIQVKDDGTWQKHEK